MYIVPSRGRPDNIADLILSWKNTVSLASATRLLIVVDEDDPALPEYKKVFLEKSGMCNFDWISNDFPETPPHARLGEILNHTAQLALRTSEITILGFMGDDHRPRTRNWDLRIFEAIDDLEDRTGEGIVYGNDLIQGENLPTSVAMSIEIVRALGFMVPPGLRHMYLDNFWRDLGRDSDCLKYLPDVVIEHLHPIAKKAAWDAGYTSVGVHMGPDSDTYQEYLKTRYQADLEKVRRLLF